ncbi:MAG: hypothetical protein H7X93_00085 [Sphingomonadaceae bacterium]|nr:hypothetical protein [Sphingomonadaceae bacterium]
MVSLLLPLGLTAAAVLQHVTPANPHGNLDQGSVLALVCSLRTHQDTRVTLRFANLNPTPHSWQNSDNRDRGNVIVLTDNHEYLDGGAELRNIEYDRSVIRRAMIKIVRRTTIAFHVIQLEMVARDDDGEFDLELIELGLHGERNLQGSGSCRSEDPQA